MKRCSTGQCKSKSQDTSSHSLGWLYQKDNNEKPGILLVGKVVQVAWENHMAVPQKFEHGVTYDPNDCQEIYPYMQISSITTLAT